VEEWGYVCSLLETKVTVAEGGTCVGRMGPGRLVVTGLPKSWKSREFAGYCEIQEDQRDTQVVMA